MWLPLHRGRLFGFTTAGIRRVGQLQIVVGDRLGADRIDLAALETMSIKAGGILVHAGQDVAGRLCIVQRIPLLIQDGLDVMQDKQQLDI